MGERTPHDDLWMCYLSLRLRRWGALLAKWRARLSRVKVLDFGGLLSIVRASKETVGETQIAGVRAARARLMRRTGTWLRYPSKKSATSASPPISTRARRR